MPPPRPRVARGLCFLARQACFVNKQRVLLAGVGGVRRGSEPAGGLVPKEIPVFAEDANYCFQPIVSPLLPVAR